MSLAHDYMVIRDGAAIGGLAPRAQLAVAGNDRSTYLQGLLTNDIPALTPGTGCYAAWLTPQGRMLTDMHVLESGDMILLDVPRDRAVWTLERLDQYLFGEDVRLESLQDVLAGVWVHGPQAAQVLTSVLSGLERVADWPSYTLARAVFGETPVVLARIDQLGVPGYCAFVAVAQADVLLATLHEAGARPVGRDALEAHRIEAGYPLFGIDMTEDTIPLEAGIEERAISFSKGCYVGQEVIIRVLHRGHGRVAKKLVRLNVDAPTISAGAKIRAGEREIGLVTSAARSPESGTVALGYVHRDFVEPGTEVQVEADGRQAGASVISRAR